MMLIGKFSLALIMILPAYAIEPEGISECIKQIKVMSKDDISKIVNDKYQLQDGKKTIIKEKNRLRKIIEKVNDIGSRYDPGSVFLGSNAYMKSSAEKEREGNELHDQEEFLSIKKREFEFIGAIESLSKNDSDYLGLKDSVGSAIQLLKEFDGWGRSRFVYKAEGSILNENELNGQSGSSYFKFHLLNLIIKQNYLNSLSQHISDILKYISSSQYHEALNELKLLENISNSNPEVIGETYNGFIETLLPKMTILIVKNYEDNLFYRGLVVKNGDDSKKLISVMMKIKNLEGREESCMLIPKMKNDIYMIDDCISNNIGILNKIRTINLKEKDSFSDRENAIVETKKEQITADLIEELYKVINLRIEIITVDDRFDKTFFTEKRSICLRDSALIVENSKFIVNYESERDELIGYISNKIADYCSNRVKFVNTLNPDFAKKSEINVMDSTRKLLSYDYYFDDKFWDYIRDYISKNDIGKDALGSISFFSKSYKRGYDSNSNKNSKSNNS